MIRHCPWVSLAVSGQSGGQCGQTDVLDQRTINHQVESVGVGLGTIPPTHRVTDLAVRSDVCDRTGHGWKT